MYTSHFRHLKFNYNSVNFANRYLSTGERCSFELPGEIEKRGLSWYKINERISSTSNFEKKRSLWNGIQTWILFSFLGLHGIELSSNPWTCDCRLRPLKHWLKTNNVPYTTEPVCASPARLTGKKFGDLEVDEFACPPEIISAPRYVEAKSGKLLGNTII